MANTLTPTNKTYFNENQLRAWYCDLSWTPDGSGNISVTGTPFEYVAMALLLPTGGTWATMPTATDLGTLTTRGTIPFSGCAAVVGATTARLCVWGW